MFKLKESLEAKTFIEMALKDEEVLRLLCTHHSSLSICEEFNFPMLFSMIGKARGKAKSPFSVVAITESTKAQYTIDHITESAKPRFENFMKKILTECEKAIENIEVKSDILTFQEKRDQQILQMIISQVVIKKIADERNMQEIVKIIEDLVLDEVVPFGLSFVESFKKGFIDFGNQLREKIIAASGLDEKTYEDTLFKLKTTYKVIKPFLSIYWCENQNHDHYSFFMFTHSTEPKIKCPMCDRILSVGTLYYFIPPVNFLLRSKEGLIQSLTMHVIDKAGLEWSPGVYLKNVKNDTEKDIVFRREGHQYGFVEIKSFATDVPQRTRKEHIKQLMNQALKYLNSYLKQNIIVSDIYLVTNYQVDEEIRQLVGNVSLQNKYAKLKEINLRILGPNNLQSRNNLKRIEHE